MDIYIYVIIYGTMVSVKARKKCPGWYVLPWEIISHNCTHGFIFSQNIQKDMEIFQKIWQLVSILPTPKSFGTSSVVLVHRYDSCGYSWHFRAPS